MMNLVFSEQIGHVLEVYINEIIVKTNKSGDPVADLEEVFQQLRRYNLRLNPDKCTFGAEAGKFLGFLLTSRGIEVNPGIKRLQVRPGQINRTRVTWLTDIGKDTFRNHMVYTQTTEIQLHPGVQQHDLLKEVAEGIIINSIEVFPQGICFLLGFLSNSGLGL
jgi:hypothetical protein